MITVDVSVIEEWYNSHKKQCAIVVAVILVMWSCWFILYGPLINYYKNKEKVGVLIQQWQQTKQWMSEKKVLINKQRVTINQLEQEFNITSSPVSPIVLLSQHLHECFVTQYSFSDEKRTSNDSEGRALFILEMTLNYAQANCVLTHFSDKSIGWNLLNLSLGLDESNQELTMRLGLERLLKDIFL